MHKKKGETITEKEKKESKSQHLIVINKRALITMIKNEMRHAKRGTQCVRGDLKWNGTKRNAMRGEVRRGKATDAMRCDATDIHYN